MLHYFAMKSSEVRIIGGQFRSRKLRFPAIEGLRPTPDRIRETLFNWLAPKVIGAHCLDLFAGSGALGIEALSRGAEFVTLVDQNPKVVSYLREQLALLKIDNANAEVICQKIAFNIPTPSLPQRTYDIIFLDPPFHQNLVGPCCQWLAEHGYLAKNAYLYIEAEATLNPLPLSEHCTQLRSKTAGQVGYHLICYNASF